MWCYLAFGAVIAYFLVDLHYFLRMGAIFIIAKFRSEISILDTNVSYGVTLPSDVDFVLDHMNNARVFREFDFGRVEFGLRSKIWNEIFANGGGFPINANFIRYRLPIKIFSFYKVETRITHWNSTYLFLEQKLVTLHDGITRAVAYPKVTCYNFDGLKKMEEMYPGVISPGLDDKMQKINEICEITSQSFKPKSK